MVGLVLSWKASQTCDFISFVDQDGNPPDGAEGLPFSKAVAAHVGIFRYEITTLDSGVAGRNGCIPYDLRFSDQQDYPSLATAQFCAVIGPCFALIGTFLTLVECCVCNVPGSFALATLFLLVASGVQGGVFTLFADPVFWYVVKMMLVTSAVVLLQDTSNSSPSPPPRTDMFAFRLLFCSFEDGDVQCQQGKGVYLAAAATVLFLLAACFHCVSPRFDPFCVNFGRRPQPAITKADHRTVVASTDDTTSESLALEEGVPDKKHLGQPTTKQARTSAV